MDGREYFDFVTIDGVNIYSVASQPSFVAPRGSLAMRTDDAQLWQNEDGATTWTRVGIDSSAFLLLVPISGTGTVVAPEIDPDGRRNICYVPDLTVDEIEVVLPPISSDLAASWRITLVSGVTPAPLVRVTPELGDLFVNTDGSSVDILGVETTSASHSCSFVHDGDFSWSALVGGMAPQGGDPPVWTVDPAIAGGPWPGGLVVGTSGTVVDATSGPDYEYEIDAVGTGDTSFATFVAGATQYSGSLTLYADASNAGGTTPVTSNALTMQRVRGVTSTALSGDYLTTGSYALPASGVTLIIEMVGYVPVTLFEHMFDTASAVGRIVITGGITADSLRGVVVTTAGSSSVTVTPGLSLWDGATRWFAQVTFDGAEVRMRWAAAEDVVSLTSSAANAGSSAAALAYIVNGTGSDGYIAGAAEAKVLSRALSDVEFLAVVASPIGIASLDGDADILMEYMPTPGTESQEDSITLGSQIDPAVTITAGSARMIAGRLNVGDAVVAPVWLNDPSISGEPWPGGTVSGLAGIIDPGALTTVAHEYEVDAVGTGDTSFASFTPAAGQYSGSLTLEALATNALGSTPATSNALALQRVRGITRPTTAADRPVTAAVALPGSFTLICEIQLTACDSAGRFAGVGDIGDVNNYARLQRSTTTDSVFFIVRAGGVTASVLLLMSGIVSAGTHYVLMLAYDGVTITGRGAPLGGATLEGTAALVGPLSITKALTLFQSIDGGQSAGSAEAKVLSRVLSLAEFDAVAASPIGLASLDGDAGIIAELYPAVATAYDGNSITAASEITGAGSIVAGSARMLDGGLNE